MANIEIHDHSHVHIGKSLYRLRYTEDPRPGFHRYSVETSGSPRGEGEDRFDLTDLTDLHFKDLPESFSLSAYQPRLDYRLIDSLSFQKENDRIEVALSFSHSYQDWTHTKNLIHFYQSLRTALLNNPPYAAQVDVDVDEYGVSASVRYSANEKDDIASHIARAARHIHNVVQGQLIAESASSKASDPIAYRAPSLKPDEHGWKWWLRFILVPIGIALIAVIAAIIKLTE